MLKRKSPPVADPTDEPPTKKRNTNPGSISFLSANVCGFDAPKWANLKKMADDNDIDVIMLQEGAPKTTVDKIVGTDWESFVTKEAPYAKKIGDTSVPSCREMQLQCDAEKERRYTLYAEASPVQSRNI